MDEQGRKLFESRAGGHDTRRKSEVRPPKQLEKQHPPGLQDYRDETPETPGLWRFRLLRRLPDQLDRIILELFVTGRIARFSTTDCAASRRSNGSG
jgi:hypothetical protein